MYFAKRNLAMCISQLKLSGSDRTLPGNKKRDEHICFHVEYHISNKSTNNAWD